MLNQKHHQGGFTLIEVVIAFAIFTLAAGTLYATFSMARKRSEQAQQRELALLTAQSLLARQRSKPFPWSQNEHGRTTEGMEWQVSTALYGTDSSPGSKTWTMFEVNVLVYPHDRAARNVRLSSLEWVNIGKEK